MMHTPKSPWRAAAIVVAGCSIPHGALAHGATEPTQLILTVDQQDLTVLSQALGELPYKLAAPIVDKLNKQIQEQRAREARPAEPEAGK